MPGPCGAFRAFMIALALWLFLPRPTAAALIVNGGFETGNFADWTVADQLGSTDYAGGSTALGGYFVQDNSGATPVSTPLLGFSPNTIGPASGNYFALSDSTAPGTHALIQSFVVPTGVDSVVLSFDMFVYDWSGLGPVGTDLDFSGGPNQHARVDLLTASAGAFDTGAAAVVSNLYSGVDPESTLSQPPVFRHYDFDLTSLVTPGGTYQLRFAEVDNQFVLNQGVDNVGLAVTYAVPEPATATLFLSALAALLVPGRLRSRRAHARAVVSGSR